MSVVLHNRAECSCSTNFEKFKLTSWSLTKPFFGYCTGENDFESNGNCVVWLFVKQTFDMHDMQLWQFLITIVCTFILV